MNVVITGGAGFIGSHFVHQLVKHELQLEPSKISVIDNLTYASNIDFIRNLIDSKLIEFIHADISESHEIESAISGCDIVINFAAESHVDNSIGNSSPFIKTNIVGVENLLRFSQKYNVKRFVQISTDEVYGSIMTEEASESSLLNPSSPYSASKAAADLLSIAYNRTHGLNVLITRSCNNFGINQHKEKFIPKTISAALKNENIIVYGNGKNIREWINVEDNCKLIAELIRNPENNGVYNITSGLRLSNLEVVERILNLLPHSNSHIEYVPDRKGHDYRYAIKSKRIQQNFEYTSEEFDLDLAKTIKWYEENAH